MKNGKLLDKEKSSKWFKVMLGGIMCLIIASLYYANEKSLIGEKAPEKETTTVSLKPIIDSSSIEIKEEPISKHPSEVEKKDINININVAEQKQTHEPKIIVERVEERMEVVVEKEIPRERTEIPQAIKSNAMITFIACEAFETKEINSGTSIRFRVLETNGSIKKNELISTVAKVMDNRIYMKSSFIKGTTKTGNIFDGNHLEGLEKITERNRIIITEGTPVFLGL